MPTLTHLALLVHFLIELPASVLFFLRPSQTLSQPQPHAHGVIRQYALLLVASELVVMPLLLQPVSGHSRSVAGALAVYHLGPTARFLSRWRRARLEGESSMAAGAATIAVAHAVAASMMIGSFFGG
jgi:hypothetical protein